MPQVIRTATINASAERVFSHVDDIRNLARHMSEGSSMQMGGSKLTLQIVTPQSTGEGATYRYTGQVMGMTIDFSETVTHYVSGREKVWRTIGTPRLVIVDNYEMRLAVEPLNVEASRLTIVFNYTLPRSFFGRLLGKVLAPYYGRWCLDGMLEGTARALAQPTSL